MDDRLLRIRMLQPLFVLLLALLASSSSHAAPQVRDTASIKACKRIPGDAGWPGAGEWTRLNRTVEGRLIRTEPIATLCHNPHFDLPACQKLRETWMFADAHIHSPAEFVAPYFQNRSCDPYTSRADPCSIGNYAQYSINVSEVEHIQAGIRFARQNNIRLTIKNTGHDLLGKSTGRGALSLWTHHMNTIDFIDHYRGGANYTGPAVRLGAGVLTEEAFTAANARGVRIVTGTCPTVGVAGGYTAGGGHGVFTSLYGLAADNVLEWEVVTADGRHVVATPTSHTDLYWALSGGGSGTFAVIVSMVTRVYRDGPMGGASLAFDVESAGGVEEFWHAVSVFQSALGPVVDAGTVVSYALTPTALNLYGISVADGNASVAGTILRPVASAMARIGISLQITKTSHPGFLDFFDHYFSEAVTKTPHAQITGGRLVPRSLAEDRRQAEAISQAFRAAAASGFTTICNAVNANRPLLHPNAVSPAWRSALLHCIFVKTWDFHRPWAEMVSYQKRLTEDLMPQIEAATPGGGAYINEANFQQAGWQEAFYGANYPRLKNIKSRVDPQGVFYAQTAVGSDEWAEDGDGRLCRT
ncbi:FAD-binding domain-containing protein [Durotheca rogersii]|uniref:FAD-binding domain-containing protein n=1 Tax=Durotheca rogersii TaxID=419775 RepID=UPI00221F22B0|nr:FAD-binding domain-containing protein [Durotheca rogersii]KAI5864079.1 FAD-binding domain-containing protein [Durotheca rogersii]